MVKSVPHFDNFTKWIFFSVNICPLFSCEWCINLKTLNQTKHNRNWTVMIPISSATQWLTAIYTLVIFVIRAIHVSAIVRRTLNLRAKHLENTFSTTFRWMLYWDVHFAMSLADRNYQIWLWSLYKDPLNLVTTCQTNCFSIQWVV
jgi:hypothetical protein